VTLRPGRGLLSMLGGWVALGLAATLAGLARPWILAWAAVGGVVALAALVALWRVARATPPAAERWVVPSLPLGAWTPVELRLSNPGRRALDLEVHDLHPAAAECENLPRRLALPPRGWAEIEYRLRPLQRGDRHFEGVAVELRSFADLWRRRVVVGDEETVRVIPDFRSVARYGLFALSDTLGPMGLRLHRRRGEGSEFQQLREYRAGDSLRRIDWKATARRQQLISREYDDERNQQIVCLIDCGRRMRSRDGEASHFDQALNAVLLLSFVALRQGDAVGVMTFSGERRWLPPTKGRTALQSILDRVYDLETTRSPSDYLEAATRLMARQRRRALVVLLSNLRDEDSDELRAALELLRTRNLVLLASLRESVLAGSLEAVPRDLSGALRTASVHRYLEARRKSFEAFQVRGVLSVDAEPEVFPARIVNRYLDVKRSGML